MTTVNTKAHDVQRVALRQLQTALRLYFEKEDYYSVITLAGASEEIFGKLLSDGGRKNALDSLKKTVPALHRKLYGQDLKDHEVSDRANKARNDLKHWSPGKAQVVELDAREEARDILQRAIDNYYKLTQTLTAAMQQFGSEVVTDNAQIRS